MKVVFRGQENVDLGGDATWAIVGSVALGWSGNGIKMTVGEGGGSNTSRLRSAAHPEGKEEGGSCAVEWEAMPLKRRVMLPVQLGAVVARTGGEVEA